MTDKKKLAELVREAKEKYIYSDEIAQYLIDHGVVMPVRCKDCKYLIERPVVGTTIVKLMCGFELEYNDKAVYCDLDDFCEVGVMKEADNG